MKIHMIFMILSMSSACRGLVIDKNVTLPENSTVAMTQNHSMTINLTENTRSNDEKSSTTSKNFSHPLPSMKNDLKLHIDIPNNNNFSNKVENLRNIIVLMVQDIDSSRRWEKKLKKHSVSLKKFVTCCPESKNTNDSSKIQSCQCDRIVQDSIDDFLSWAEIHHEMNTAVISDNLSLPAMQHLKNPPSKIDNGAESFRFKLPFRNCEPLIPPSGRISHSVQLPTKIPKNSLNESNDRVWDIFNTISKIRRALLQCFFKYLHDAVKYISRPKHKFHPKFSPRIPKPNINVADLMSASLMDLQSLSNEKGFIVIVLVPPNDVEPTLQVIDRQIPKENTLVVVSGSYSHKNNSIPVFAFGPGSTELSGAQTVAGLFNAIESLLGQCLEDCKHRSTHFSLPLLTPVPKRRFVRSNDDGSLSASPDDEKHIDEFTETTSPITSTSETTDLPNLDDEPATPESHAESNTLAEPESLPEIEENPPKNSVGTSYYKKSILIILSAFMPVLNAFQSSN